MSTVAKPLAGIKVLDISRVLAGPWCGQMLADMGAEVIKVERPQSGDDTRHWGPPWLSGSAESAYYLCANRGKRSVTVDMAKPEGQALIKQLAAQSDVVLENFKVGGLKKYGLDYASLKALNPGLVYCSITGFGQQSPYAHRAGYDFMIQAMGGLMSLTGKPDSEPGGGPVKVGVAITDIFTGLYAANAVLAALYQRRDSGEGCHIDLALMDVQVGVLANQALNYLTSGQVPQRLGNAHPNIVPYQAFATADGHMIVAVGNDEQFRRFCQVTTFMWDFIIVGGGILGFSTAMQLQQAYPDKRLLVLEKEAGPAQHQTGHNSGVIHAGVYYTPGSLKAKFCLEGNRATREFCDQHGVRYDICGKLLVATNPLEKQRMEALWERTAANGLEREWLEAEALKEREPNITGVAGIFVPSSGIVNYAEVTRAMAAEFTRLGGEIRFDHRVTGLEERTNEVVVTTQKGAFTGRYLVSCSGLMADRVIRMLGKDPGFTICPFRGEYYLLPERHNQIVNHLIYPIPDPAMPFLGVHLTRMIDGTVTVGPNAVLALKREGYRKQDMSLRDMGQMFSHPGILKVLGKHLKPGLVEMRNSLYKRGYLELVRKYCPSLTLEDLTPYPAGVRAQAVSNDGRLVDDFLFVNTPRTVNVGNAPSPAATSALPIGAHIVEQVKTLLD